jgi:hypothetical protein
MDSTSGSERLKISQSESPEFDEWDHIITSINIGETLFSFENKT